MEYDFNNVGDFEKMTKLEITQKIAYAFSIASQVVMIISFIAAGLLALFLLLVLTVDLSYPSNIFVSAGDLTLSEFTCVSLIGIVNVFIAGLFAKSINGYLKLEIADGTPFVKERARLLRRVGLEGIVYTLVAGVITGILAALFEIFGSSTKFENLDIELSNFIGLSIALLAISLILELAVSEMERLKS